MTTPDFESLYSQFEALMLTDAYKAITECDLWDWMRTYSPEEGKGFMFSDHPNLKRIDKAMKFDGHSGSSYGWTMRNMESIAKHGWEAHKSKVRAARETERLEKWAKEIQTKNRELRESSAPPCYCRAMQGYTSGWCGVAGGGVPGCDH
jgi:hypothetical protein